MAQHLCQGTQAEDKRTAAGANGTSCRREPRIRNIADRTACEMISIGSQRVT
jgi:hypothetical protein